MTNQNQKSQALDSFTKWLTARGYGQGLRYEELMETGIYAAWVAAWNAAIDAVDDKVWEKRDLWDSPTKERAAEEIGRAIRELILP